MVSRGGTGVNGINEQIIIFWMEGFIVHQEYNPNPMENDILRVTCVMRVE